MKIIKVGYAMVVCGAVFLAFCFYLDRYRHYDSNYRRKLRDRRQKLRKQQLPHYEILPRDFDPKFREAIIINEIEAAEQLMTDGKIEEAVIHFAHAIAVCSDPAHLLSCLRQTLPSGSYDLLIKLLVRMYGDHFSLRQYEPKICSEIAESLVF